MLRAPGCFEENEKDFLRAFYAVFHSFLSNFVTFIVVENIFLRYRDFREKGGNAEGAAMNDWIWKEKCKEKRTAFILIFFQLKVLSLKDVLRIQI